MPHLKTGISKSSFPPVPGQRQERLKNEMTLTFNVYNTLAQKQEQDKLRVQEQTPVYTIIEPATVPLKASAPKKVLILIGCMFSMT